MSFFDKFRKRSRPPEVTRVTYEQTFEAALAAEKQGFKAIARELFERVAEGVPKDRASCHALGLSYFGDGDYAQSANWFGEVLRRSEVNDELRARSLAFLAQCFLKMGDRKQAVMCLKGLHVLRPGLAQELAETLGLLHG